jgi:hypothetical protein
MRSLVVLPLLAFASLLPHSVLAPAANSHREKAGDKWSYREMNIEGWTIFVQKELCAKEELCTKVLDLMKVKLWEIATRLPAETVARLQEVELRMHLDHAENPGAAYHPNPVWLREHGMPEDWALGIEFGNAKNFLGWSRQQPGMVLHELAHAWHHQVMGYEYQGLLDSFAATAAAGTLNEVLYVSGGTQKAYALNNEMEFFAEMSEAWWMTNDMYPFVRGELLDALPDVAQQMDVWWQLPRAKK